MHRHRPVLPRLGLESILVDDVHQLLFKIQIVPSQMQYLIQFHAGKHCKHGQRRQCSSQVVIQSPCCFEVSIEDWDTRPHNNQADREDGGRNNKGVSFEYVFGRARKEERHLIGVYLG